MHPELELLLKDIALYGQWEFESGLLFNSQTAQKEKEKACALSRVIERLFKIDELLKNNDEQGEKIPCNI